MARQTNFSVLFQGEKGESGPPGYVSDLSTPSLPFLSLSPTRSVPSATKRINLKNYQQRSPQNILVEIMRAC